MSLVSSLRELGLHKSEIAVYLYLLRNGASSIANVSHGTNITRTNCYYVIRQLLAKGLIRKSSIENRNVFIPTELASFDEMIESKRKSLQRLMPELEAAFNKGSIKPQVFYYSTEVEISKFIDEFVKYHDILFYGPRPNDPELIVKLFQLLKQNPDEYGRQFIHPRRVINNYFLIWADRVGIIPISKIPFLTVIQNSDYAASMRSLVAT